MLLDNGILHLRKLSAGYKLLSFFELKIREVTSQNECIALARCHTTQKLTQSTKYPHRRSPHLPITKRPHYTRAKKNYTPTEPDPSPFARPPEKVHRLPDIVIIPIRRQALSKPGIEPLSYPGGLPQRFHSIMFEINDPSIYFLHFYFLR